MMKAPLVFGILLLVCAQSTLSAAIAAKRGIEEDLDVPSLNQFRKQFADTFKIANMHEMRWDSELAKKAEKECNLGGTGPNYMITVGPGKKPSEAEVAEVQKQVEQLSEEQQKHMVELVFKLLGPVIVPTQDKIGCAKVSCGELTSICLVGPKSDVSESDFKKGEPGSQCPNGKASSGLCNRSSASSAHHQENASSAYTSILVLSLILSFL